MNVRICKNVVLELSTPINEFTSKQKDERMLMFEVQWLPTLKPVFIKVAIAVIPMLLTFVLRRFKRNEITL